MDLNSVVQTLERALDDLDKYKVEKTNEDELYEESEEAERIESAAEGISNAISFLKED